MLTPWCDTSSTGHTYHPCLVLTPWIVCYMQSAQQHSFHSWNRNPEVVAQGQEYKSLEDTSRIRSRIQFIKNFVAFLVCLHVMNVLLLVTPNSRKDQLILSLIVFLESCKVSAPTFGVVTINFLVRFIDILHHSFCSCCKVCGLFWVLSTHTWY